MFTYILAGEINYRLPFGVTCPIMGWVQGLWSRLLPSLARRWMNTQRWGGCEPLHAVKRCSVLIRCWFVCADRPPALDLGTGRATHCAERHFIVSP